MVTDFRCWWQNHYVGDFFRYVGDFLNVLNLNVPTSQTCHQHIWSPTSVTNIDVAIFNPRYLVLECWLEIVNSNELETITQAEIYESAKILQDLAKVKTTYTFISRTVYFEWRRSFFRYNNLFICLNNSIFSKYRHSVQKNRMTICYV